MNEALPRAVTGTALAFLVLVSGTGAPAASERWVRTAAPPEMSGDAAAWWLDTGSILRTGNIAFFTFLRGTAAATHPAPAGDEGRSALDCRSGKRWAKGVCSGSCQGSRTFPDDWLEAPGLGPSSELFRAVCGSR